MKKERDCEMCVAGKESKEGAFVDEMLGAFAARRVNLQRQRTFQYHDLISPRSKDWRNNLSRSLQPWSHSLYRSDLQHRLDSSDSSISLRKIATKFTASKSTVFAMLYRNVQFLCSVLLERQLDITQRKELNAHTVKLCDLCTCGTPTQEPFLTRKLQETLIVL